MASTPAQIAITPGTGGAEVATWQILEQSQTKQLQRVALSDSQGNDAGTAIAPIVSVIAENVHLYKSAPGIVFGLSAVNLTQVQGFLLLIDTNAIPIDGAVSPVLVRPLMPEAVVDVQIWQPYQFNNGIVAVLSSNPSPFTKTTGTINGFISCQFI